MKAAFINWSPTSITAIQLAIDKENDDFFDANEVLYDQTFSLLLPSLTMDFWPLQVDCTWI